MDNFSLLKNSDLNSNDSNVNLSNIYAINQGGFGTKDSGIKTYFCSAKVSQLKNDIETFEKLTQAKSWPVSQIIQREINDTRVEEISSQYILKDRNIKYFPPIIVAILPRHTEKGIADNFTLADTLSNNDKVLIHRKSNLSESEDAKKMFLNAESLSKINGFYVLDVYSPLNYKVLGWDKNKYYAVVIDGQHRLESLKYSAIQNTDVNNYLQDVVFIDLSERAIQENMTPVEAVRRIFIDINYKAEQVTQARRCLMDDKDLASLFVQTILNDDDSKKERIGEYLIPQTVDWHSENLKHQLPHLTGVLVLYQLMSDIVLIRRNIVSIDDLRNKSKVKSWVNRLEARFQIDERIRTLKKYNNIQPLSEAFDNYLEERKQADDDSDENSPGNVLFEYDYRILEIAQESFKELYLKAIVLFFNDLKIYKKTIDFLRSEGGFNKENILSKLLITNSKKYSKSDKKVFDKVKNKLEEKLNSNYYILLTVLGQKTLFELFFKEIDNLFNSGKPVKESIILETAESFILKLNRVIDILDSYPKQYKLFGNNEHNKVIPEKILTKYSITKYGVQGAKFWEDIIFKDTSIIYNNQGVSALKSVIEYIMYFVELNRAANNIIIPPKDSFNLNFTPAKIAKRLIIDGNSESVSKAAAEDILNAKKEFLDNYLSESITSWKDNTSST